METNFLQSMETLLWRLTFGRLTFGRDCLPFGNLWRLPFGVFAIVWTLPLFGS